MWTLEKVMPRTYHVHFRRKDAMGQFFLRFQEYYESPKYRNKFFTLGEFKKWYSKEYGNGEFTYFTDWVGYNVTSDSMRRCVKYCKSKKARLTKLEKEAFRMFEFIDSIEKRKWSLIGTFGNNKEQKETLNHELAHAMFANITEYREEATKLVLKMPKKIIQANYDYLKSIGYDKKYYIDECNAYWSTGYTDPVQKLPLKYQKQFQELFIKYRDEEKEKMKKEELGVKI